MADTQIVRQFFRDIADHLAGVTTMPAPEAAAELLRKIADSEPAVDGGWQIPQKPAKTNDDGHFGEHEFDVIRTLVDESILKKAFDEAAWPMIRYMLARREEQINEGL